MIYFDEKRKKIVGKPQEWESPELVKHFIDNICLEINSDKAKIINYNKKL